MRLPAPEYLPANMYHDLWSPARMLMPAKKADPLEGTGQCVTSGSRTSSSLSVEVKTKTPAWALETDPQPFENLSSMLVCCP
jgi:hypothetical protein